MISSLGINKQNEFIKNLLGDLAYADFYHDFGNLKFDTTKLFKEVSKILKTTESEIKIKEVIDYVNNNIKDTDIKTVYEYFKQTDLLTPATEKLDDNYLKEDKILDTILGNNVYKDIKETLKTNEENYFKGASLLKDVNIPIDIEGEIRRNYKYSVYPTKKDGEYYNLSYSYREVSNNNNFILLIDSSFFSFSSLRDENNILKITDRIGTEELSSNDINRSYTFYIIKNSENFADPATKISLFNKGNQRIKIKILKDNINTNIKFPAYSNNSNEQNNNLFSSININTTNVKMESNNEEKINAEVNYPNKPFEKYDDISSLSDINNATLNALIESYGLRYNPLREENNNEDKKLKSLIYLLLKRSGDWSQALSLLYRERIYEIYDYDTGKNEGETTLNQLKMKEKADIALVTHDRILLAYSILLGLNVFYSLKTKETKEDKGSTIWNVYFKNNDDTIQIDKTLYNKLSSEKSLLKYIKSIEEYIEETDIIYQNIINELENATSKIPEDIIYNPVNGKLEYKTTYINPLETKGNPTRKEYLQINPKSHIKFFQEFIIKLRKVLTKISNLTLKKTIFKELEKLKEIYDEIKSNINQNHLYKVLDETYYNIENLYTINTKLDEIYTEKEQENDKKVIEDYFNYITNFDKNVSIIRNEILKKYEKLLNEIGNNYIISKKILPDNKIFVNGIIPTIDVLIYNNISIGNRKRTDNTKNNICRFIKELRNKVTPVGKKKEDMNEDKVKIPSSEITKNNIGVECDNNIISSNEVEGSTFLEDYHKLAVIEATRLKAEGKPYNEVYIPLVTVPSPAPINDQEALTQVVSMSNSNSNNSNGNSNNSNGNSNNNPLAPRPHPPPNKMIIENFSQSGGYKIEYIYDGKGNFYSTISEEEKDPTKKLILLYLDSLFSRLFSLKQYPNGGDDKDYPSFDDNVYEQYLIIFKELKSIDLFLETKDIKELIDTHNNKRYQWRGADLKPYMKELDGGLDEVDDQLHKYYEELHHKVSQDYNKLGIIRLQQRGKTMKQQKLEKKEKYLQNKALLEKLALFEKKRLFRQTRRKINNSVNPNTDTGENTDIGENTGEKINLKYNRRTRVKEKRQKNSRRKTRNKHGISQTGLSKAEKRRLLFQQMRGHY